MPSNSLNMGSSPDEPDSELELKRLNKRLEIAQEWGQEFLFMSEPEFDEAVIGVVERAGGQSVIAYDTQIILSILERDMSPEEAQEFFEYNILGAYLGEMTPVFITRT